jgi:hypothetical protein
VDFRSWWGGGAGYYFAWQELVELRVRIDELGAQIDEHCAQMPEEHCKEAYLRGRRDALRGEIVRLRKPGAAAAPTTRPSPTPWGD